MESSGVWPSLVCPRENWGQVVSAMTNGYLSMTVVSPTPSTVTADMAWSLNMMNATRYPLMPMRVL